MKKTIIEKILERKIAKEVSAGEIVLTTAIDQPRNCTVSVSGARSVRAALASTAGSS